MGPLGGQEMIVIFILALLLFGPKKLPELGRMLGKGLSEFRRAKNELKATFETHLSELEKETQPPPSKPVSTSTDYSSVQYPYAYDEYGQYGDYSSSSGSPESPAALQEAGYSEPSGASADAIQDGGAHGEQAVPQNAPVAGTVPRSNGVQAVQSSNASAVAAHPNGDPEEEHSA